MPASSGVEDALKILKKLKNCDALSEADLLDALSRLPCPEEWNIGDLHSALLAGWGEVVREMVEVLCGYDKVLCGRQLASLLLDACFSGELSVVRFLVLEVKCWSIHHYTYKYSDTYCTPFLPHTFKSPAYSEVGATSETFDLSVAVLYVICHGGHLKVLEFFHVPKAVSPKLLITACFYGHVDIVRCLIYWLNVDPACYIDKNGLTPFYLACFNGHLDVVKILTEHVFFIRRSELHIACYNGHLDVVKYLVTDIHVNPNLTDEHGLPLHHACLNGRLAVVKYLITDAHVDPNVRDRKDFTPLCLACTNGHLDVVKYLVMDAHVGPNLPDEDGLTALHHACYNGHLAVVEYLITDAHVDPHVRDHNGFTPLCSACTTGHLDVVKYLVTVAPNLAKCTSSLRIACSNGHLAVVEYLITDAHVDPHVRDHNGFTPLCSACTKGHLDVVKYLLTDAHVNPNVHEQGLTSLCIACSNGHLGVVKYLVTDARVDPTIRNYSGLTPLHLACKNGHLDVVKYLLAEAHAKPNVTDRRGSTPLHLALENGQFAVIEYLETKAQVDPNIADNSGLTPFYLACEKGHLYVAKNLVTKAHVIDPNVKNERGSTPLLRACVNGLPEVVEFLVTEARADPNLANNYGLTPLHFACEKRHLQNVQILITKGHADPNVANKAGYTPLHFACKNGYLDIVKYLITVGNADPNVTNRKGATPLHLACKYGYLDIAKFLIAEGHVDPNSKDEFGLTPLHYACRTDHPELVEWLFKTVNGGLDEDSSSPNTSTSASLSDDWHVIDGVPAASERAPLSDQWYLIQLFLENGTADYQFLPNLKILVVGNASAGKSTLVKALQDKLGRKGLLDKFTSNFRTVSGVELKTAGIVPTTIQTESLGYITFYDFAGQCEYYSSHAAMLKNLTSSLDSLVLIVIDLSQDIDQVNTVLNYWKKFVSSLTADKDSKPHQQIVFTHSDLLSDSPMLRVNLLKKISSSNSEILDFSICINCTKASSNGLTFVYDLVRNRSSKLQSEIKQHKMRPFFAASNYFMSGFCADKVSFHLEVLLDKFNNVPLPLVKHLLHTLSKQGKILFLENEVNIENSWIILDVQTLMAEVNGTIFSPENFKQHHMSNSTGVVPLSAISTVFSDHNKKMIVDFLCHFEFCHKIASTEADLIGRSQEDAVRYDVSEESYYFFPALVRTDRPVEVFSTPGLSYKFGWFLKCNDGDFLFPRFPHVLVLRLAFSFALAPDPEDVDTSCPVLQRKCDVWKCGISWQNRDGVEVVVEVVEESTAVVVVVGCLEGREWAGMRLRSEVIRTVYEVKEEHAKETEMSERVIHPKELGSYPLLEVDKLSSFTMHEISCVIANGQHVVTSKQGSRHVMISMKELLFFEPYSCFGHEITSELFNEANSDVTVPETFLYDAGKSVQLEDHVMVQESLKMILPLKHSDLVGLIAACDEQYKNDPAHQCYLILRVWKKGHCNPTFSALREALNKCSVFAGRNPLRPS